MSVEANKVIARRYWEAWKTGNLAIIDEIFATDHVFHNAAGGVVRGRDRTKHGIMSYRTAFPNLHFLLEPVFTGADSEQYGLEETSFLLGRRYPSSSL